MIQVLSETVKDGRVVSLVHRFFRSKINDEGKIIKPTIGMPQGGPLSPVCANILLNELDQLLDGRGHRYVRYADDMLLQFRSHRAAERVFTSVKRFIEEKLFLKVNVEKTKICHLSKDVKFLGYSFYKSYGKDDLDGKGKWKLVVHSKKRRSFEQTVKTLLDRKCPKGLERCKEDLKLYLCGWTNYFYMGLSRSSRQRYDKWIRRRIRQLYWKIWKKPSTRVRALMKLGIERSKLSRSSRQRYDRWIRRRIRQLYWKIWKKPSTRVRALMKLGIERSKANDWGNSSKAYWRVAGSWILGRSLTDDVLQNLGWIWLGTARKWSPNKVRNRQVPNGMPVIAV